METVEKVVDDTGSDHETRVDGATNNTTQWVPSSVIKPVVKVVETLLCQVFSCAVVEVGIKLVNDRFKSVNSNE